MKQVQQEPVAVGGLHRSNTHGGTSREVAVAVGSILGEDGKALTEEDRTATVRVDRTVILFWWPQQKQIYHVV